MTLTINAKAKAKVDIRWREELVEDQKNFYIKLSPDVEFEIVGVDVPQTELDKVTAELQDIADKVKVKK